MSSKNKKAYIPERGDIIWLNFNPQAGHEQAGKRPAIVLSPSTYNQKTGLALCCPITSKIKGYPFEILLPQDSPISGVILTDQIKNLDWKVRKAEFIHKVPNELITKVVKKLRTLLT